MLAKTTFDEYWEVQHSTRQWGKYPSEFLIRFLLSRYRDAAARKNIKVLEIGCGAGANAWFLAKEGFNSYGFDASPSAVVNTNNTLKQMELKANIIEGDATKLDAIFPAVEFDVIFDICTLCHIPNVHVKGIYKQIAARLKKGGHFFSVGFAEGCYGYGFGEMIEENTYSMISDGPLKGIGVVRFTSLGGVQEANKGLYSSFAVDEYNYTMENRSKQMRYHLITGQK